VIQVLLRVLVLEQTMPEAVAAPRLHQQWSPSRTLFEPGFDPQIVAALESRRGHAVEFAKEPFGCIQAIWLREIGDRPVATSDARRGGTAGVQGGTLQPAARPPEPPPGPPSP
jgi:gamma-glutamyltranspeptidase/glutathione hydrolase